jgi:hypothetical protein
MYLHNGNTKSYCSLRTQQQEGYGKREGPRTRKAIVERSTSSAHLRDENLPTLQTILHKVGPSLKPQQVPRPITATNKHRKEQQPASRSKELQCTIPPMLEQQPRTALPVLHA